MNKIFPKCKNLKRLYVTADSQILPCCDVSIINNMQFNVIDKWNLKNNSIDKILTDVKKWANGVQDGTETPFAACSKVCGSPNIDELPNTHLELSTRCTLKCPKCPRTRALERNLKFNISDLNFQDFKKIIDNTNNQIIHLCGTLGDPIFHPFLTEIVQYIEKNNKFFVLATAAPGKSLNWWEKFYNSYKPKTGIVRFGLDGLQDTAHLYRVGTDFNKMLLAMRLGVELGKRIQWQFIPFSFNEH